MAQHKWKILIQYYSTIQNWFMLYYVKDLFSSSIPIFTTKLLINWTSLNKLN